MAKSEAQTVTEVRSAFVERRRLRRIRMIVELTHNLISSDVTVSHREAHRRSVERDQRPVSPPVTHQRCGKVSPLSAGRINHLDLVSLVFVHSEIEMILAKQRVPHPAVLARAEILRDEVAEQFVASISQNAPLRIEDPLQIS